MKMPTGLKRFFNGFALAFDGGMVNLHQKEQKAMEDRGWVFSYLGGEDGKKFPLMGYSSMYSPVPYHMIQTAKKGEHSVGSNEWYKDLVAVRQIKHDELPKWVRRKLG